jgi:hypothetical protein
MQMQRWRIGTRPVPMVSPDPLARGLAWTTLSLVAFVAALFAVLLVLAVAELFAEIPHLAQMAMWSVTWGLLSVAGVLIAARIAFGYWLSVGPMAWGMAATGVVLSAIVHVVLQQWEIQRFGLVEPDSVGLTAGLFAILIALATAAFGTLVAPRGFRAWPAAVTIVGVIGVIAVVALNLPGLDDGLAPESLPLAFWLGLSVVYALAAAAFTIMRSRAS